MVLAKIMKTFLFGLEMVPFENFLAVWAYIKL
jgi:hypothetical protein